VEEERERERERERKRKKSGRIKEWRRGQRGGLARAMLGEGWRRMRGAGARGNLPGRFSPH